MNELVIQWLNNGKEIPPHLKSSLESLSGEHISGISLAQLDSPMMKQYRAAKEEVPDALLFFRMGDFYELFGADAIIASELCGLTLTSRDKSSTNPIPMAGAPAVGYKSCLKKCLHAGFKVAICDQVEDPRQAKGIVRREITRIATPALPGDLEDETTQAADEGCYLACTLALKDILTLAFVDVSTGEFRITSHLTEESLAQEIATLRPKEILTSSTTENFLQKLSKNLGITFAIHKIDAWIVRSPQNCEELYKEFFPKETLHQFGISLLPMGLEVVCGLLAYLKSTQKSVLKNIPFIKYYQLNDHLLIDDSSKKHLDFFFTSTGEKKGSLFHFLNHCSTAAGSRLLVRRLNYPFKDLTTIQDSHTYIEKLISAASKLTALKDTLSQTADIERIVSKIAQKNVDAKILVWLRHSICLITSFKNLLLDISPKFVTQFNDFEQVLFSLKNHLQEAYVDDPSSILGKGGKIFRSGFNQELDEVIELEENFQAKLDALEKFEKDRSQIPTLKIGYTRVFGYYFEISKGKLAQVPTHFLRKQTLSTGERFITTELKELEEKFIHASEKRYALEKDLLEKSRLIVLENSQNLISFAELIAKLDLICNFAQLSLHYSWCKPVLCEQSVTILRSNVHPLMAARLQEGFVSNDVYLGHVSLSPEKEFASPGNETPLIHLITGPNMAGKSTLMRQVALAHILGQMGCFVPAKNAVLGIVDRVLTRIGSADHGHKNQSTFMVEMLETAHLIRQSSARSLLLLDEIGRGTSTYDGLSLAWSIVEYLHKHVQARTLFSTHYHELVSVCEHCPQIVLMQMKVLEQDSATQGKKHLIFSRQYVPGSSGKSYGIAVAKLAGLPQEIILRAEEILHSLEKNSTSSDKSSSDNQEENQTLPKSKKLSRRDDELLRAEITLF